MSMKTRRSLYLFVALAVAVPTVLADTIYIDAHGKAPAGWNAVDFGTLSDVDNLVTTNGSTTTVSVAIIGQERMNRGVNSNGTASPTGDAAEFKPAGTTQRFGNTSKFGNETRPHCEALITGLTAGKTYDFTFYASRMEATENRETRYTLTGASTSYADLDVARNTSQVAKVTGVQPNARGEVTLNIAPGPDNKNKYEFYYLLAMKIDGAFKAAAPVTGRAFSSAQEKSKFIAEFRRWARQDVGAVPAHDSVLCVGSSSMRMWRTIKQDLAPLDVIHRGFGGSTMAQVLLFMDFFARYQPQAVLVYEGDNDLMGACTPERYVEQCREFVAAMQAAREDTVFYFLPAKPSPSRWHKWDKFQESNTRLKEYCEATDNLHYVDIATPMLGPDGKPKPEIFLGDKLHMNAEGYKIWTTAVRAAMLGR